jgi:hypothetical protein
MDKGLWNFLERAGGCMREFGRDVKESEKFPIHLYPRHLLYKSLMKYMMNYILLYCYSGRTTMQIKKHDFIIKKK